MVRISGSETEALSCAVDFRCGHELGLPCTHRTHRTHRAPAARTTVLSCTHTRQLPGRSGVRGAAGSARRPWIGMNGIVKSGTKDTGGSDEGRHLRQLAGQATTELAATSKPPVAGDRCSTNSLRSGDTTSGKRGRPKQAKSVGRSPRPITKNIAWAMWSALHSRLVSHGLVDNVAQRCACDCRRHIINHHLHMSPRCLCGISLDRHVRRHQKVGRVPPTI